LNLERLTRTCRRSALTGFLAWCALGGAIHLRWTTLNMPWGLQLEIVGFLLLGPLVVVPLALALAAPDPGNSRALSAWRAAVLLQPPATAALFASFFLQPGTPAAALALPWAATCAAAGLCGLLRFLPRKFARPEECAVDAGLVFLPVGSAWLLASRAGMTPMGFQEPFVLLTAVHFHFAGLAAPVLAGVTGRHIRDWRSSLRTLNHALSFGIVAGVPLLAAGIASSRPLELAGALLLAFSVGGFAFFTLFCVVPRVRRGPAVLLALAALCAVISMHYAGRYAMSHFRGTDVVSLTRMAGIHGFLNALGFACGGLWGWTMIDRKTR
jgi:hypothetical protein